MWMTIDSASETAERAASEFGSPPAHCPHPNECLRLPLKESRSFCDEADTRRMMLNRYRRLMAQNCACNSPRLDVKT
jgi:hypothetical protein